MARIDEIRAHAVFVRAASDLTKYVASVVDWTALGGIPGGKERLSRHLKSSAGIRLADVGAALTLQSFASFEWFIRSILIAGASYVGTKTSSFSQLPTRVSNSNITLSASALRRFAEAPPHLRVDVSVYCRRLGGCHEGSESFDLNTEAFGMFLKTLDAKALSTGLGRLGVILDWDVLGKSTALAKIVGEKAGRKAGKAAAKWLDSLAALRNELAHEGSGVRTVSLDDLARHLDFLDSLAGGITALVGAHLKKVCP